MVHIFDEITRRRSVRSYSEQGVDPALLDKITNAISSAVLLFKDLGHPDIRLVSADANGRLGTYGVIKGARHFLVMITPKDDLRSAMQGAFVMEQVVLKATGLGLGTVWLGGTFNSSQFGKAVGLAKDQTISIVCPLGYAATTTRFVDKVMRRAVKSDDRKPFSQLFTGCHAPSYAPGETLQQMADKVLIEVAPGDVKTAIALEAVRLAPSSCNYQPWRGNAQFNWRDELERVEFTAAKNTTFTHIDMAICYCHFALACEYLAIEGHFVQNTQEELPCMNFLR